MHFRTKVFWLFFFCLCLCIEVSTLAQNLDYQILKTIHIERNQNLDPFFHSVSATTGWMAISYPVGLGLTGLIKKDSSLIFNGISAGIGLGFSACVSWLIKETVNRKRPFETYPEIVSKYNLPGTPSFPSGHTTTAFETATDISLTFRKWYFVVPAYAWAGTVAYARLHEGVHYPSDVLAGAILGSASAWLSFKANRFLRKGYSKVRKKRV